MKADWKSAYAKAYQHSYHPERDGLFIEATPQLLDYASIAIDEPINNQVFEINGVLYECILRVDCEN
jgi:hypothetical protein